jgi:hypothetical protein
MPEETIYTDQNVAVTTDRIVIAGTTYAVRNLTSVRMTVTPQSGCARIVIFAIAISLIAFGLGMGFICVGVVSQSHEDTMVQAGVSVTWAVMAIVSVGAGVLVIARSGKALGKERYNVTIVSSAG